MNAPHACPRCGRTLPDDAPHGLCPSCLFGAALAGPGETVDREPVSADQNNTSAGCTALDSGQPENHVGETIACDSGKSVEGDDPTATASIRYFGDYILLRRLGHGGMGEVWLAHQNSLDNRPVAVKMLRAADLDAKDRVRFRNEAEAIAALDHPNLIEIYEVGEHEGEPFYSMKLYSGGSLNDHLSEFHDDPKRTARVMSAVACAVHHVHQRAILHRDLKPANVLLDERGEPHVADFGLAKRLDIDRSLSTIPGAILGTPPYMSPEQAIGRKGAVTTSSDVYGLGAILYSLLTGDAPFAGDSVPEVLQAVCEQAPEPPSRHNPKLPRDLEVICLKCLEKSPQHRYPSAAALAEDLERFLKGEPIIGRPVGSATRFWMWCRRNPWLAGAVGSTAAALVAVALLALLYAERQSKLVKVESEKLREQTEATRKIGGLATDLKTSLGESNRRLASLHLQRAETAFEAKQFGASLLWAVESWRAAEQAGDTIWKHAARATLGYNMARWAPLKAVFSHPGAIAKMAISPDGRFVLISGFDRTARLWDAESSSPLGPPIRTGGPGIAVAIRIDCKAVLTVSDTDSAMLYDTVTGRPAAPPFRHPGITCVALSPDGKIAYTGGRTGAGTLWDSSTAQPLGSLPKTPLSNFPNGALFTPDGKTVVVVGQQGGARFTDTASGRTQLTIPTVGSSLLFNHPLSISSDGQSIVTVAEDTDPRPQIWDTATGASRTRRLAELRVHAAIFRPDGKVLATGGFGQTVQQWESRTGQLLGTAQAHQSNVSALAYNPDGMSLAAGYTDGRVIVSDTSSGKMIGLPLNHEGAIRALAFTPDGRALLIASTDGTARIWDTSRLRATDSESPRDVIRATFSPDLKVVLLVTRNSSARLWDVASGRPLGPSLSFAYGEAWRLYAAVGSDNKTVVMQTDRRTVCGWDGITGRTLGSPLRFDEDIRQVQFSSSGKVALISNPRKVRLWDVPTGQPLGPPIIYPGDTDPLPTPQNALGPDGKTTLIVWPTARLWDATTGRVLTPALSLPHGSVVMDAAFRPDGRAIATACHDGTARIWDTATGKPLCPPLKHASSVGVVAFHPDGHLVLTGSYDGTARVWDAVTGHPLTPPMRHRASLTYAFISPDGRLALTICMDGTYWIWDLTTGRPLSSPFLVNDTQSTITHPSAVRSFELVIEGTSLPWDFPELPDDLPRVAAWVEASTGLTVGPDGSPQILDTDAWHERVRRLEALGGPPVTAPFPRRLVVDDSERARELGHFLGHTADVMEIALTSDGTRLVSGSQDGTLRVWLTKARKCLHTLTDHNGRIWTVAVSPDGKRVLSGGDDKILRLWDLEKGALLKAYEGHGDPIWAVAFTPDGERALSAGGGSSVYPGFSVGKDRDIWVRDLKTGEVVAKWSGHKGIIDALAVSADGKHVLSASNDKTARLWDMATGKELRRFHGQSEMGLHAIFSPDGKQAIVASEGHVVRVFDVETGKELAVLEGHTAKIDTLAASPDGRLLISGSWPEKTLRIWDLKESRQIGSIKLGTNPYLGTFSPNGRQLFWGCSDGTIRQISLPESVLNRDHPPGAGTGDNGASATTAPSPGDRRLN